MEGEIFMIKKIVNVIFTVVVLSSILTLTVYAGTTAVTKRVEVEHNGTVGSAYSSLTAVNTTLYNGTYFYWTATVANKPSSTTSTNTQVSWKIYKNSDLFSNVGSKSDFKVGNTTSTGTVVTTLGSGKKTYTHLNNRYKMYINVSLCPPAYAYYTTFNFGGVFYGYN